MRATAFICAMLFAMGSQAAKQYQPSGKVLEQMMEIELERYQHKFGGPEKIDHHEAEASHEISLAQTESLLEATIDQVQEPAKPYLKRNISNVYGARAGYIANTLQNSSEYVHYILLWAVVFSAILFALTKITKESV